RRLCQGGPGSAAVAADRTSRQESVLQEAATRVRRHTGLPHNAKHNHPLVVVVTKYDAWAQLLGGDPKVPAIRNDRLDLDCIEQRSKALKELLFRTCPEIVSAAQNFAEQVLYVPVSAL